MKKQTLFDLASMPKMVLVIVMIVMIGTLFGATSYLLKAPKTDLPIINLIVETQCEIDSDCSLAYTGSNACLPCDTSIEEYKCFPLKEAKKIEEERFKKMVNDNIFCEKCLEKSQHICKCENGKCEKVKEELVEEVSITTDKMEYEQGEEVKLIVRNNLDEKIVLSVGCSGFFFKIQKFSDGEWKQLTTSCGICERELSSVIDLHISKIYNWNQQTFTDIRDCNSLEQVSIGKYRAVIYYMVGGKFVKDIYSNEFTIKEKSALDARCEEKLKGIGSCKMGAIGYEFDSILEKCVEKIVGGCSFKIPFGSLEECQEVCGESEKETDSQNILSDEEVYEILKKFAVRPNAANISDDNILLDAIEFQNGDIKERLKKVEHDLNEIGIGDAIDWRGYVKTATKVCIARSIIYNNLKHTCDLKHDSLLSLEDVDDLLATEEIIPYFLVGFTYFKSGDYAKANYYLDQIILHRQAEIDRWGESYFINTSGEVYEKIYKKTMQVLNEIEIAANS